MEYKFSFSYLANGSYKTASGDNDDFTLDVQQNEGGLKVILNPNTDIKINRFFATRNYAFADDAKFFANGFQSWTDSREFSKSDKMNGLGLVGKSLFGKIFGLNNVGDYNFVEAEKEPGRFHAHSLAYVRTGDTIDFFGSMTDRTGYTIIYADMNNNTLAFSKDLEGKTISEPYEILDLVFIQGEYDEVFDKYFEALGVKPLTDEKIKGYTSWYNYYQNISEEIILRDLNSLYEYKDYVNTYQIDDGYQTAVGDWFSINAEKFPNGMKPMVEAIHSKGFTAGLWLAPFGAQKGSKLAKDHPDWLIKDSKGKPIPVGANWGGFYAIDIYNDAARSYIKKVFNEVLNVWGFDLVKLDFLYAASIIPMYNKTRGEIAYDAIDLLRECVGDKKILGCGVQQMPCFGKVEFMRIGPDMALWWKHNLLRKNMHREDVSTPNALHNSIYRRCFNKRAFLCDPDVFLLRRTNIKFTPEQQKAIGKFIKLFGGVLFMSDNVAEYDDEQLEVFKDILTDNAKVLAVNEVNDTVFIDYEQDGKKDVLKFNIKDGTIY
jgi:alpha-galactosidase